MATRRPRAVYDAPSTVRPAPATPTPYSESTALQLWVKLLRAQNAIVAHAHADVARHGLTLAEFGILEALYHRGPMLLGELQRRILVSSGGITFLVDRLTQKELVERRTCQHDRRARFAALTTKGEELVARIFPQHVDLIDDAMQGLTQEEQQVAGTLLRKLGLAAAALPIAPKERKRTS